MTFTVESLADIVRAKPDEIQGLLDDGTLKSLCRADVEEFVNGLAEFFTDEVKLYKRVKWQRKRYLRVKSIRRTLPKDVAHDASIDALLRCRKCWLKSSPLRPLRYLRHAVRKSIDVALAKHWATGWIEVKDIKLVKGENLSGPLPNIEAPEEHEDIHLRPVDDPHDYCATDDEHDVITGIVEGLTYREIEERYGIDDSTAWRTHQAIRDRYTRLCA